MASELERAFRRRVVYLSEKYGVNESAFEQELYEALLFARSWQPSAPVAPDKRNHPAVKAVETVVGHAAPREMYDEIIELVGQCPDLEDLFRARRDWVRAGKDPNAWIWLKWTNSQRSQKPVISRVKIDPFAGLTGK